MRFLGYQRGINPLISTDYVMKWRKSLYEMLNAGY